MLESESRSHEDMRLEVGMVLESESRLVSHGQSRPCPWGSYYKLYNGLDCILGSRPTHIRLYAPADRRRIDMRPQTGTLSRGPVLWHA